MFVLKANQIEKSYNGQLLFKNVQIDITEGEHAALVGPNGIGKTTLLRILAGMEQADSGTVQRLQPLAEWGFMEQQLMIDTSTTLLDYVLSGQEELYRLKQQLMTLQDSISAALPESEWMEQYTNCYSRFEALDGYGWELQVEKSLQSLGLPQDLWRRPFFELSGGQKTRAQLARLLARKPLFLILDEPTNHLDPQSLEWLENWLNNYRGAVLIVSHDRFFLDQVAHSIITLTSNGTSKYKGGYSDYRGQRQLELQTQQKRYEKEEKERKELLEMIRSYREWYNTASDQAKKLEMPSTKAYYATRANKNTSRLRAKEKALERLELNRVAQPKPSAQLAVEFKDTQLAARTLIRADDITFAYPGQPMMFQKLRIYVERGDRMVIGGPNGAGKSTLLKLLTGQLQPASGEVVLHPQLNVGYLAQELESMNDQETILDSLLSLPNMTQTNARTILGCFLFRRDDVFKQINHLSMGEKCRLAFVRLYFGGANVLVLDEPTNYLDIDARERIEEALLEYPGTLILISHDRYLVRKVSNRIVDLSSGTVTQYQGDAAAYEEHVRDGAASSADLLTRNRIRQLELQLAQFIGQEEPVDSEGKQELLKVILGARAELESLSRSLSDERKYAYIDAKRV